MLIKPVGGAPRALEDAREQIANLLDAFPDEVLFTSGAPEAAISLSSASAVHRPLSCSPVSNIPPSPSRFGNSPQLGFGSGSCQSTTKAKFRLTH